MRWLFRCAVIWLFGAASLGQSAEPPQLGSLQRLTKDGAFKQRPLWSADGKELVFARHDPLHIFLFVADAQGNNERRLTTRELPEFDASWSPDGKRLAFSFVSQSGTQGDVDVFTINANGQDLLPLAVTGDHLSHEESPAWSPAGSRIAFTSTRDGNQEVYTALPDGGEVLRITNDPAQDAHPSWSPDGKHITFATDRWGDLEIAICRADGTEIRRLTQSKRLDDFAVFSPNGKYLAFASLRTGDFDIHLLEIASGESWNLTNRPGLDNFPAWTPEGKLAFVADYDGAFDIYLAEVLHVETAEKLEK